MTLTRLGKCLPEPILLYPLQMSCSYEYTLKKDCRGKRPNGLLWSTVVFSMRFTLIQVHRVLYSYIHLPFKLTVLKSLELLTRQAKLPQHFVIQ